MRQSGFTYMGMLILTTIIGIGLSVVGEVWQTAIQRDKELELLMAGRSLRVAIASYYQSPPGGQSRYPGSLENLLKDDRTPSVRRHLRQIPRDPITGKYEWGIVSAPGGGVMGVHSLSTDAPLKVANFPPDESEFEGSAAYKDWRFIFSPALRQAGEIRQ